MCLGLDWSMIICLVTDPVLLSSFLFKEMYYHADLERMHYSECQMFLVHVVKSTSPNMLCIGQIGV